MFVWILFISCIVITIAGIVLTKLEVLEIWGVVVSMISGFAVIILGISIVVIPISIKNSTNQFIKQKAYIESHIPKNNLEDAAITTKKIELNDWLYESQWWYTHYRDWNFYTEEIMELKPIE